VMRVAGCDFGFPLWLIHEVRNCLRNMGIVR